MFVENETALAKQEIPDAASTTMEIKEGYEFISRHKFEKLSIPEGKKSVIESCACGQKRLRYKYSDKPDIIQYLDEEGKILKGSAKTKICTANPPQLVKKKQFFKSKSKVKDSPIYNSSENRQRNKNREQRTEKNKQLGRELAAKNYHENVKTSAPLTIAETEMTEQEIVNKIQKLSGEIKQLRSSTETESFNQLKTPRVNIDLEARLKESLVLINLMFQELVKNDVLGKVTNMAGRFLYSQGYEELAKYYQNKA